MSTVHVAAALTAGQDGGCAVHMFGTAPPRGGAKKFPVLPDPCTGSGRLNRLGPHATVSRDM